MRTHSRLAPQRPAATKPVLSFAQLAQLRRALEDRRAQVLHACEDRAALAAEEEPEEGDVADAAEGVIEDRERHALDEHDRAELGEIEHALAKLDDGSYGISEASGRPIPFERLLAVPWARHDAAEAERIEHQSSR